MIKLRAFHFVYLVTVIVALAMGLFLYWTLRPYNVIKINSLTVLEQRTTQGQVMTFQLSYCKASGYDNAPVTAAYSFTDEISYNRPPVIWATLEPGCHVHSEAIVSPHVPPGPYSLEIVLAYKVNPVRTIPYHAKSAKFDVLAPVDPFTVMSKQLLGLGIISSQLRQFMSENEALRGANQSLRVAVEQLIKANARAVEALPKVKQ